MKVSRASPGIASSMQVQHTCVHYCTYDAFNIHAHAHLHTLQPTNTTIQSRLCTHTGAHVHSYTYTHQHALTCTRQHVYAPYAHEHFNLCTPACSYLHEQVYSTTGTFICSHFNAYLYTHTPAPTCVLSSSFKNVYSNRYTHTFTCGHSYMHIRQQIQ